MREAQDFHTGKVSEIVRQLNLAGIAIIWIFRAGNETGGVQYSSCLKWPLGFFILSLVFDLVQYAYQSIVWASLNRYYFLKFQDEKKDVTVSGKWNLAAWVFFGFKTAFTVIAYILLFTFLFRQF